MFLKSDFVGNWSLYKKMFFYRLVIAGGIKNDEDYASIINSDRLSRTADN
jgi:hypothetical protein